MSCDEEDEALHDVPHDVCSFYCFCAQQLKTVLRPCKFASFESHVAYPASLPSDRSCSSSEGLIRERPGGGKVGGFRVG
jgi:hypothetical protein